MADTALQGLVERFGADHVVRRLGIEAAHEKQLFGQGTLLFNVENWKLAPWVVETALGSDELLGGPGSDSLYGEAGNDILKGGAGDDTYGFEGAWGQDTIEESAGAGNHILNFSGVSRSLTVVMGSLSVIEGENRVYHAGNNIETLIGGSGVDVLIGQNQPNTWAITRDNAGNLNGGLTFSSIENLMGGSNSDTFVFTDGKGVSGTIDGKAGTNSLDYSAYSTSVTVNLAAGTTTGTGSVVNMSNIIGGSAGDSLT